MTETYISNRLVKNSFLYTLALLAQRLLAAFYFWYYSNNIPGGVPDLGRLQFILSFVALWFIIGDLGLYPLFLRESSKSEAMTNRYLNVLFTIKAPFVLLASIVILTIAVFTIPQDFFLVVLALLWIIFDNVNIFLYAVLKSRQMLQYESAALVVYQIIVISIGIFSIHFFGDIAYLILALLIGSFLNFLFVISLIILKLKFKFKFIYDKKLIVFFLKMLPIFALSGILVKILNSIDIVFLKHFSSDFKAVGFYSIPLKFITALSLTLPMALMGAVYPVFSRLFVESKELLGAVFKRALEYLAIISIPISFGFLALGDEVISALWNKEFLPAIFPAKMMLFALPFIFLAFPTGNLLNAIGRQKNAAVSRAIGLIILLIADVLLIPEFGIKGAAFAIVLAHISILCSDLYFVKDIMMPIRRALLLITGKILISSVIMFLFLQLLSPISLWYVLIPIGGAVYGLILFTTGGIDIAFLKKIILKNKI